MSTVMPASAGALLTQRSFLLFLLSRSLSRFSSQIGAVAIGWQIYDLTGSALDLGMVGLVQFLPTALLVFFAGQAADRYERKRVMQACQLAEALTALFLGWGSSMPAGSPKCISSSRPRCSERRGRSKARRPRRCCR
jgi:MFS family permease